MSPLASKLGAVSLAGLAVFICAPQLFSNRPAAWASKPDPRRVERPADDRGQATTNNYVSRTEQEWALTESAAAVESEHAELSRSSTAQRFDAAFVALGESSEVVKKRTVVQSTNSDLAEPAERSSGWMVKPADSQLHDFVESSRLRGVLFRENALSVANLDGKLIYEGQTVGRGITVTAIGKQFVEFGHGDQRIKRFVHTGTSLGDAEVGNE